MSKINTRFFIAIFVGIAFLIPTVTTYLNRIELINSGLESTATVTSFGGGALMVDLCMFNIQ